MLQARGRIHFKCYKPGGISSSDATGWETYPLQMLQARVRIRFRCYKLGDISSSYATGKGTNHYQMLHCYRLGEISTSTRLYTGHINFRCYRPFFVQQGCIRDISISDATGPFSLNTPKFDQQGLRHDVRWLKS